MVTSPYRRGADDGFLFGLYLTLMFFGFFTAQRSSALALTAFALAVFVPLVIFLFMRRYDRQLNGCVTFPMFWMQGMMIFICGILIAGAFTVIYLTWIEPDFIFWQFSSLAEVGSQPDAKGTALEEMGEMASQMIEKHMLPTPISIVVELILIAIVSGSLLSILLACYFTMRRRFRRNTTR